MHTNTIPSKFVRFFTRYNYSHVAISLDKNCDTIYSFGRKNIHSFIDGGFVVENKNGEFFNFFNKTVCKIYEIDVTDKQYKDVKKILNDMEQNSDKFKYDVWGVIPRFFGIPITFKNKYVCSYFVAYILDRAKIYKFDKRICLINPSYFEKIYKLNLIYSGSYLLYE